MNQTHTKNTRALAIAPSTRGFGFAVMEGQEILVDWGVKSFQTEKSKQELKKAKEMIEHYQPNVIVLPKEVTKRTGRSGRSRTLALAIIRLAKTRRIKLVMFSRQQTKEIFFNDGKGNMLA